MPNLFIHNDSRTNNILEIRTTPPAPPMRPRMAPILPGEVSPAFALPAGKVEVVVIYQLAPNSPERANPQLRHVVLTDDLTEHFTG